MPAKTKDIPDPWTGETFITLPDPTIEEVQPYIDSLTKIPKSGLHNPYKNPERLVYLPLEILQSLFPRVRHSIAAFPACTDTPYPLTCVYCISDCFTHQIGTIMINVQNKTS